MRNSSLRTHLTTLAASFTEGVLAAIRGASVQDLLAESTGAPRRARAGTTAGNPKRPRGRLARRSPEDIARTLAQVVALVKKSRGGMRAEAIRTALKLDRREVPRVLHAGLSKKVLRSKGQKRSTTYFAR